MQSQTFVKILSLVCVMVESLPLADTDLVPQYSLQSLHHDVQKPHLVSHVALGSGYDDYGEPFPFQFTYHVHDDDHYVDFTEQRSGDEAGNIVGQYQVALPDGRIQYVEYNADGLGGTVMKVRYGGTAVYPPPEYYRY